MQRSATSGWTQRLDVAAEVSATVVEVDDGSSDGVFAAVSGPRVHTGRMARANARICDRAFACSCLLELNVSVVADQLTLSSSRARARMFCYGTFTHPLSSAYERPAYRISLCVLACVGCGTRGRLLGLSGRIFHNVAGCGPRSPFDSGSQKVQRECENLYFHTSVTQQLR